MALKYQFKSKDEVPAEHLSLYTERDGAFFLDVEGAVEKAKLDEFRKANQALTKERDALKQRFDGIDPDEVNKLVEEKRRLEEQAQLKAGEVDKVIEKRVKAARSELEKQIGAITAECDALNARLAVVQIDQTVLPLAMKRGLRPTAVADLTAHARDVFRLVNGVPTAFEADGKTVRAGKDGATPLTLDEWLDAHVSEAPHLFEPNAGIGAGATTAARSQGVLNNPFKRETWNLTEQMRLLKRDPALAQRLRAAAQQ
jgi:hypothetical protein